jgi:hypothetical protein
VREERKKEDGGGREKIISVKMKVGHAGEEKE